MWQLLSKKASSNCRRLRETRNKEALSSVLLSFFDHRQPQQASINHLPELRSKSDIGQSSAFQFSDVFTCRSFQVDICCFDKTRTLTSDDMVGDPLEKAALKGIEWTYKTDEKAMPKKESGNPVQIVQRYHFASDLKLMSVIARVHKNQSKIQNSEFKNSARRITGCWLAALLTSCFVFHPFSTAFSRTSAKNMGFKNQISLLRAHGLLLYFWSCVLN